MTDQAFLEWIHDRLEDVYGENINYDYMIRLRKIARQMSDEKSETDTLKYSEKDMDNAIDNAYDDAIMHLN